jgi:hypothetical protein
MKLEQVYLTYPREDSNTHGVTTGGFYVRVSLRLSQGPNYGIIGQYPALFPIYWVHSAIKTYIF